MFFCKKKAIEVDTGKAYAVCLARNCPEMITIKYKKLSKFKKKYAKSNQARKIQSQIKQREK